MKKVGYTVKTETDEETRYLSEVLGCQIVFEANDEGDNYSQFETFLKEHKDQQIVLMSFESMGLQLGQLAPIFHYIRDEGIDCHFVEKPFERDEDYLQLLTGLALSEKEIVSRRTLKGLRVAHAKGVVSGRPAINEQTIDRIRYLHTSQKKNIRQISTECGVSLGTVHKYIKREEEKLGKKVSN
ncbi:recombinase family protein [Vagococcus sp. BWB3-3]|uniref:Recombinase family protein n=1 Tax=Vagococcus allomyrinae TaxID=2794353 RepID=A0A940P7H8_9ENTE|nr:recombinase family protein [Vagococcus allomyrinae]MBP1042817.1 recombinase family protein [Vagococcus allomyrinae]